MNLILIKYVENWKSYGSLTLIIDAFDLLPNCLIFELLNEIRFIIYVIISRIFVVKMDRDWNGFRYTHLEIINKNLKCVQILTPCNYRRFIMIVFMYHTLCRFDCITHIQMKHITFHSNFFRNITAKSKTDQEDFLFPPLIWLTLLKCLTPNPIKPSSYKAACTNLKKCLIFSHIDLNCISLYSMSIGGATDALSRGVPDDVLDAKARWRTKNTKKIYDKRNF